MVRRIITPSLSLFGARDMDDGEGDRALRGLRVGDFDDDDVDDQNDERNAVVSPIRSLK